MVIAMYYKLTAELVKESDNNGKIKAINPVV